MNIYALFPLIATLAYIPLLVTIFGSRPWSKRHKLFILFLIPAIVWSLSDVLFRSTILSQYKFDLFRLIILAFAWAAVQFHCLISSFFPAGKSRWLPFAYGTLALVIVLVLTGVIPASIKININGSLSPNYGIGIFALIVPFITLAGRNYYVLIQTLRITEKPEVYNQIVALILGLSVLLGFTLASFIPLGKEFPISHFGNLFVALILFYAVLRHELVPINFVIRKGLVWITLGILAVLGYWVVVMVVQRWFGFEIDMVSALAASMLAVGAAAVVYTMRNVFIAGMNRLFGGARYIYRQNLDNFVANIHKMFNFSEQGKEFLLLVTKAFDCNDVSLLFLEPNSGNFVSILIEPDTPQNPMAGFQLSGHNPIVEHLKREFKPLATARIEILPEFKSMWLEEQQLIKNRAIEIFVPLVSRNKLIGILLLSKKQLGRYSLSDYNLLEEIAERVAVSMEKEYIQQQLKEREKELSIINRSNLIITSSLDIQRTYNSFTKEIRQIVDVSWTVIEVVEENEVRFLTISSEVGSAWQVGERILLKDTAIEWVCNNKLPLIEADLLLGNRFVTDKYHVEQGLRSIVHIPLMVDEKVIGVLAVASRNPNAYSNHQMTLLQELSSHITESVENSRLFAKAEQMARVDGITGLLNRNSFDEQIGNEVGRHMRYGGVFSVIVIDVDSFKTINDSFGHQVGDQVLKQLSNIAKNTIRSSDQVFRYGGDEFVILLPETNTKVAANIAERVGNRITRESKLEKGLVTISLGVAGWPEDALTADKVVAAADVAMYAAKKKGGNCIQRFEPSMQMDGKADALNVNQSEYLSTIYAMAAAVDARDRYTRSHSQKVNDYAMVIAESLKMNSLEINRLSMSALLHDLGKIGVSSEILNKSGSLSNEDWEVIKQHPQLGAAMIRNVQNLKLCAPGILCHHERYDGKGYPQGLKGQDIPLDARILAIADSFAAMTSERHYSIAMTYDQAIDELKKKSGTQFDPELVEVFTHCSLVNHELERI